MRYNTRKGYIALTTVLTISAIGILIGLSTILLAMIESDISLSQSLSTESYFIANACAEEALIKLKNNLNYTGDEIISIDSQQCYVYPLEGSGNNFRVIKTQSDAYNKTKKIKVKILEVNPKTIIRSWRQVKDF